MACASVAWLGGCPQPNPSGDAGDAATDTPADTGPARVVQIAAGGIQHTCALLSDGHVKCWGSSEYGQNGVPDNMSVGRCNASRCTDMIEFGCESTAFLVAGIDNVKELALGSALTCALKNDGTVWCWGYNSTGQLGDGSSNENVNVTPRQVMGVSNATQISAKAENVCARISDGTVKCWGSNRYGQLGVTPAQSPSDCMYDLCVDIQSEKCATSAVAVTGLTGVDEVRVARYAVLARKGETLLGLGANFAGQLGAGMQDAIAHPTAFMTTLTGMAQLTAGGSHACFRKSDNTAVCWGYNDQGQLGDMKTGITACPGVDFISGGNTNTPCRVAQLPVPGLADVKQIEAGRFHTCAIVGNGAVKCWGLNGYGQLGNGAPGPTMCPAGSNLMQSCETSPVDVMGITDAVQISLGDYHGCALLRSGEVKCWGSNINGQLGDGTKTDRRTPVTVMGLP